MTMLAAAEHHVQQGRLDEAQQIADRVLVGFPEAALALRMSGLIAARRGQHEHAQQLFETACRAGPLVPQPWVSFGEHLYRQGEAEKAADAFRQALRREPALHDVRINLGIVLSTLSKHEEAVEAIRRGLEGSPNNTEGAIALATSLHHLKRTSQAIDVLTKAAERAPNTVKIWSNLGVLHEKTGRLEEALRYYNRAIELAPGDPQALFNRGSCLIQMLHIAEARRDWEAALAAKANDANTATNLAILELLDGNLPKGFRLFEHRWGVRHQKFPIPYPEWDGSPHTPGTRLLLYVEQGLGDMLPFCRFIPELKRRYGFHITLAALPPLHGLLASLEGVDAIIDIHPPYPPVGIQCSLLTVPLHLGTTLETIPANVPYLRAKSASVQRWKQRLAALEGTFKIGLFWQGTTVDPNRTIRLAELSSLWDISGTSFVSLQKGPGEEELEGFGLPITPIGHELRDFDDTAAVLDQLDLLITIDTAIAHAAGALARPAWVLLPHRPDWRWLLDRADSPWYPKMKLYRQHQRKDWAPVIAALRDDMRHTCRVS